MSLDNNLLDDLLEDLDDSDLRINEIAPSNSFNADSLEAKILKDVVWVKMVYPDKSVLIFRGTRSVEIAHQLGLELDDDNFILDIEKHRVINGMDCEVSYHNQKPEFERRLDRFANSFI